MRAKFVMAKMIWQIAVGWSWLAEMIQQWSEREEQTRDWEDRTVGRHSHEVDLRFI